MDMHVKCPHCNAEHEVTNETEKYRLIHGSCIECPTCKRKVGRTSICPE